MRWLKQSTAVDLPIGPFLDKTDGDTVEDALTITQPDVRLKKNGGNWAQKNAAQTLSHEEFGFYEVSLDATDTNTLGCLTLAVHESGALAVWHEFMVVAAGTYELLFGTSAMGVVATGTVSAYADTTHATLATGQNTKKGCIVYANGGTGVGGSAIVNSYTSGTGVTVFEPPGFPAALSTDTTYTVLAGPNATAIALDASDRPIVNVEALTSQSDGVIEFTGDADATPLTPA